MRTTTTFKRRTRESLITGTIRLHVRCWVQLVERETGVRLMGRGLLLWLLGIPLPIILLVWLLGGLHG